MYVRERGRCSKNNMVTDKRGQTCHTLQTRVIYYMQKASSCHSVVCHGLCYSLTCWCLWRVARNSSSGRCALDGIALFTFFASIVHIDSTTSLCLLSLHLVLCHCIIVGVFISLRLGVADEVPFEILLDFKVLQRQLTGNWILQTQK